MDLSYLRTHPRTPDENLEIQWGEHTCCLAFTRYGADDDPYPLFDVDILINGVAMYYVFAEREEEVDGELVISKSAASNWGTAQLLSLVRGVLKALDDWCSCHPQTYLSTFNLQLYGLYSTWRRQGYACDRRMDTWITYIDSEGKRRLFLGMLNLIEDKLAINDLWRVAKDTDYYLGCPFTPVDAFKQIIGAELE